MENSIQAQQETLREEMKSLVNTFADAAIELDAEKAIDLFLDTPEFFIFTNGVTMNYEQFAKAVRDDYPNYTNHQATLDFISVKVFSPDVASALIQVSQKLTHKDGTVSEREEEVTWIATRTKEGLKFIYGHGNGRPVKTSK